MASILQVFHIRFYATFSATLHNHLRFITFTKSHAQHSTSQDAPHHTAFPVLTLHPHQQFPTHLTRTEFTYSFFFFKKLQAQLP